MQKAKRVEPVGRVPGVESDRRPVVRRGEAAAVDQPVAVGHGGVVPGAPPLGQLVLAGAAQHRPDRVGGPVVDIEAEGRGGGAVAAAHAEAGRDQAVAEGQVGQDEEGGAAEAAAAAGGGGGGGGSHGFRAAAARLEREREREILGGNSLVGGGAMEEEERVRGGSEMTRFHILDDDRFWD